MAVKKKGIVNEITQGVQSIVGKLKSEGDSSSNMPGPQQMNAKPQSQYNSKYGIFAGLDE
jgi:hypothetical protein